MDGVSGGSGTNRLVGGAGEDTFGLHGDVETQVVGDNLGDMPDNRKEPISSESGENKRNPMNDDHYGYDAGYASDQQALENDRQSIPIVTMEKDRIDALKSGDPAIFQIERNPKADNERKFWEKPSLGYDAVKEHDRTIEKMAEKHKVDPDLIRAVMWAENARGHWYGANDFLDRIGFSDTVMPMNINPDEWASLIEKQGDRLENPLDNIEAATILIKRIGQRIEGPTDAAKIGSIWNFSGREKTSDFGEYIGRLYKDRPWNKDRPDG
ncbi:hypothetical protein [Magnetospira sp. QH-2]|uniref:hypothetical protein n=1 Tax=Magnetospira sp. (strain QH-2) TaxID=1288970 RepID=UPI0003E815CB|nr:hypothetical protein [Magnetospira sp. QH-2]CCQ74803.1 protein of unknown function [Magnetospira sp. QH-2]